MLQSTNETLHQNQTNQDTGWGNYPTSINPSNTFRVIGHNVNGLELYPPPDDQKSHILLENTHKQQAHAILLQENNVDFKNLEVRLAWNSITKQHWTGHHSIHSTSTAQPRSGRYLPGGTTVSVLGDQCSRVTHSGTDKTGMGRYSWVTLQGKEKWKITLISAYRVCHTVNPGPFTTHSQQCHILALKGQTNPNPRKELIQDLTKFVKNQTKKGHQIILSINANKNIDAHNKKDHGLNKFIQDTNLIDAHTSFLQETKDRKNIGS